MLNRLIGVITFQPAAYREIAEDKTAIGQAAAIVVVMAVLSGVAGAMLIAVGRASLPRETVGNLTPLGWGAVSLVNVIVYWLVGSWVIAFVAKTFFGGKANTGAMLRVFGFTQIFQILAIVPYFGSFLGLVLAVIAAIVGIRAAADISTGKAILTGVIAFVVLLIAGFITLGIFTAVGLVSA